MTPERRDAEIRLPDGTVRFAQRDGSFIAERRPVIGQWAVEPFRTELVRHTFSGTEPIGSYEWRAYFTEPGTSTVIGLVAQASFTLDP